VHADPRRLARLAREAEEVGWDDFFIWDHILFGPYGGIPMSDPWVALAAIALSTERIRQDLPRFSAASLGERRSFTPTASR
jgi:alkanesulfonate monooxygenase SsuD/methylene tetrahydromethanopterin reductase-like flavin-dependent oxidoreductase (luciferase family)